MIDAAMKRKLVDLDVAFHWCRHLHRQKAANFVANLQRQLSRKSDTVAELFPMDGDANATVAEVNVEESKIEDAWSNLGDVPGMLRTMGSLKSRR